MLLLLTDLVIDVECSLFADYAVPILPVKYQKMIGPGFATKYFGTPGRMAKYREQNIKDVSDAGFKNLRLRSSGENEKFPFDQYRINISRVVDDCLKYNVIPIVAYANAEVQSYANETNRAKYLAWWEAVATLLKDRDYRLSFNLFIEIGFATCPAPPCKESLRKNKAVYNEWTAAVIKTIRGTGGNNAKRIILLACPAKTAMGLTEIDRDIFEDDLYLMVEWHIYAAGPTHEVPTSKKYWEGEGDNYGKAHVDTAIAYATNWTRETGILTYLGAWMAQHNGANGLNQSEVISFTKYFVKALGEEGIPWSLNALENMYYEPVESRWVTELRWNYDVYLNMSLVLEAIKETMAPYYIE